MIISLDRGEPSGNLAESIASRSIIRGRDLRVDARARLDVLPGMELQAHLRDGILSGIISAVEWNLSTATMTIHAQSAVTVPPVIEETDKHAAQQATTAYAVTAVNRLATSITPTLRDAAAMKDREDRLAAELANVWI